MFTRINVDWGLGPAFVAHGPRWVDQAPVGGARDALVCPPGGPGVRFAQDLEWKHKQEHYMVTQHHFVFFTCFDFLFLEKKYFSCLTASLFSLTYLGG